MQHAYGGGGVGEGHRVVEVSKTVTQQPRPELERQISAGQRAKREPRSGAVAVGGAGLATTAAGAGLAGSGKRRIKRMQAAVDSSRSNAERAASSAKDAHAGAHLAERARTEALQSHTNAKSRQAALAHWEHGNNALPHTTRILRGKLGEKAYTVAKPGSTAHATVRNALSNQAHTSDKEARAHEITERHELSRAQRSQAEHSRFTQLHQQGVALQRKVVPKMKARIGAGRGLMAGGALAAAGAVVHTERNRHVGKSLEGASLVEIQKMIGMGGLGRAVGFRAARGGAGLRNALAPKTSEFNARVKAARANKLVPVKPNLGKPTNSVVTPETLRTSLSKPRSSELSARLAAARGQS